MARRTPKTPRRRPARRPRRRPGALRLLRWAAAAAIWGLLAAVALVGWWALDLPDPAAAGGRAPSVTVLAADGSVLATYGDLHGPSVHFEALPPALVAAVVAAEDRRFFDHGGIDLVGIARAAFANLRAGAVVQGGSTITQQVAKNLFLTPRRTLKRKVQEALLALWLERRFTKRELLAIYLNRVYLGAGVWGVEAAARRYFGKPAQALTLPEAAMIAGLPKAPSRYNPAADIEAARARAAVVIDAMLAAGFIDQAAAAAARERPASPAPVRPAGGSGRYAADWALAQATDTVGATAGDLTIATTIDAGLQRAAADALAAGLARAPGVEGALVSMAPDGAVLAMVGGSDYVRTPFNRALEARRQPGSAFKLFVYLAALEAGMRPDDRVEDRPIDIDGWQPRNFNGRFEGEMTLAEALAKSVNTVAVRTARRAGAARVVEAARRLGLAGALPAVPSLALGVAETTPLELTAAYAVLARQGLAVRPHILTAIDDGRGRALYRRAAPPAPRVVAPPAQAALAAMLAAAVAGGTGRAAALGDRPVAGKTGTSQDHRDGWFVGFTRQLATGVWIGRDDGAAVAGLTGGGLPAAIWADYMATAHRGLPALPLVDAAPANTDAAPATADAAPDAGEAQDDTGTLIEDLLQELGVTTGQRQDR